MENNPRKNSKGKKIVLIIGIVLAVLVAAAAVTVAVFTVPSVPVTIIADYREDTSSGVIQLPDVTDFRDDLIYSLSNSILSSSEDSSSPACSCLVVPVTTDSASNVLLGRNMDYYLSDKPAWVFYGESPDRYRTFNMGYLGDDLSFGGVELVPSLDSITESGKIPEYTYLLLPYVVTDVLNEKGLLIETNMRDYCSELACTGTNPASDTTICSGLLPRYLGDRCATVEEALNMVADLNVYTLKYDGYTAHYAFTLMDASGRYGVLEFADNKVLWHEGQPGQSNFWIDEDAYKKSNSCFGLGRWQVLQESAENITSENDMQNALKKVYMGQIFTRTVPDTATYDIVLDLGVEEIAEYYTLAEKLNHTNGIELDDEDLKKVKEIVEENPEWGADYLMNPENRENVLTWYNLVVDLYSQLPEKYLIENDLYESAVYSYITVFSYVTTNIMPVLKVKFFEHDESFLFGFTNAAVPETFETTNLTRSS